jgi:hypothetical protein
VPEGEMQRNILGSIFENKENIITKNRQTKSPVKLPGQEKI